MYKHEQMANVTDVCMRKRCVYNVYGNDYLGIEQLFIQRGNVVQEQEPGTRPLPPPAESIIDGWQRSTAAPTGPSGRPWTGSTCSCPGP